MKLITNLRLAGVTLLFAAALNANAESFASSSVSSAGSASSGSVSASLRGSSKSAGELVTEGDYRIVEVAQAADRDGYTRVTMEGADPSQRIQLELPQVTFAKQELASGDHVNVKQRAYGAAFSRSGSHEAFYLVLADDWYGGLAARPVSL